MNSTEPHGIWERKDVRIKNQVNASQVSMEDSGIVFWTSTVCPVRGGFLSFFRFYTRRRIRDASRVIYELKREHPDWLIGEWRDIIPFGGIWGFTVRVPKPLEWGYLTDEVKRIVGPLL
jgi:hypothetical protein